VKKPSPQPRSCPSGPTIDIAVQIEKLNQRDRTIQSRLGVIQSESTKLYNEQAGIQVKRLELMRAFDGAAKP
jgi:ribose 5-phosphate isomerase